MTAAIYARYSSDSQREASIEGQLRDCKDYAERNGITIVGTYIDRAYSAKTDDRPEFQRMVQDSARKIFDAVLVWKLDRFARNRYDAVYYKRQLEKNGVHLVSVMEPISDGPEGIMVESLLIGMAEYYSAELAIKVARGERENALKCKYNGGGIQQLPNAVADDGLLDLTIIRPIHWWHIVFRLRKQLLPFFRLFQQADFQGQDPLSLANAPKAGRKLFFFHGNPQSVGAVCAYAQQIPFFQHKQRVREQPRKRPFII